MKKCESQATRRRQRCELNTRPGFHLTIAMVRRARCYDADPWFAAHIRRIEDDAAGDAMPEVAKVRPGLYVTLTDGSAVQITVDHIRDASNGI